MNKIIFRKMPSDWKVPQAAAHAASIGLQTFINAEGAWIEEKYYEARVQIEDGPAYQCWLLYMDDWNGWMKPLFTEEQAHRFIKNDDQFELANDTDIL